MTLPHGTGSRVTICVFAAGADAEVAMKEGEWVMVRQVIGYQIWILDEWKSDLDPRIISYNIIFSYFLYLSGCVAGRS